MASENENGPTFSPVKVFGEGTPVRKGLCDLSNTLPHTPLGTSPQKTPRGLEVDDLALLEHDDTCPFEPEVQETVPVPMVLAQFQGCPTVDFDTVEQGEKMTRELNLKNPSNSEMHIVVQKFPVDMGFSISWEEEFDW
jgi:hypothetical protein